MEIAESPTRNSEMLIELTADVVAAYVSNNPVPAGELPNLIADVHAALGRVGGGTEAPPADKQKPAVNPKRSVHDDYIVCLEDGKKFKSLKRHLMTHYGLTPDQYREKWGLDAELSDGGAELCGRPFATRQEDGPRAQAQVEISPRTSYASLELKQALPIVESGACGRRFLFVDLSIRSAVQRENPIPGSAGTEPVQCLLERDVPVEIVAPMLAGSALPLAFDHPLELEHDAGAESGLGLQRFGEIEMAGDLQCRHLPGCRGFKRPVFKKVPISPAEAHSCRRIPVR